MTVPLNDEENMLVDTVPTFIEREMRPVIQTGGYPSLT